MRVKLGICLCSFMFICQSVAQPQRLYCPSAANSSQCQYEGAAVDEYFFTINGHPVTIVYSARHFHVACASGVSLSGGVLPAFARATSAADVRLSGCAPPATGYAAALRALNLTVGSALTVDALPAGSALASHHFSGLNLTSLTVAAQSPLLPDTHFLQPLTDLVNLHLINLHVNDSILASLPPSITFLSLKRANIEDLSELTLRGLSALVRLSVQAKSLRTVSLDRVETLRVVHIDAPIVELSIGASLENATFIGSQTGPSAGSCDVRSLSLQSITESVIDEWLQRCESLEELRVRQIRGGVSGAVLGAGAAWAARRGRLRALAVCLSGLRALPPDWLAGADELLYLDLSYNKIETLPQELLVGSPKLMELYLTSNRLGRGALEAVNEATSLRVLLLARNPLGTLCGASGTFVPDALSPLRALRALRRLGLARTGAAQLCADWRRAPSLTALDLSYNNFTDLHWEELQWERLERTEVDLRGNPLAAVHYELEDYRSALAADSTLPPLTTILVDRALRCDCGMYWFARALRERPAHRRALLPALQCEARDAPVPLLDVPLDSMQCRVPSPPCPRACSCEGNGRGSRVLCAGAALAAAPALPAALRPLLHLDLSRNNISHLAAEDLGPELTALERSTTVCHSDFINLQELNLTYNRLETADPGLWGRAGGGRAVWLAGNPLRCDCAALGELQRAADWGRLRCAGGQRAAAALARCGAAGAGAGGALPAAAAALGLAAVLAAALIAVFLLSPNARLRIKRFLVQRGVCSRWAASALAAGLPGPAAFPVQEEEEDPEAEAQCAYDAFVTFAHADCARAEQLAARLERGRGLRLCLHQRDWTPGLLITEQIVQSVGRSRRTVVLVSDAWERSAWARAEFRSALAHAEARRRPRPLLVLLPELRRRNLARLDRTLGLYAAAHTYLHWDDPAFWRKLDAALPDRKRPLAPLPDRERY